MSDGNPDDHRVTAIGKSISKWFENLHKTDPQQDEFEEDIMSMVSEGQENGAIQDGEAKMISNIFALDDKEARDIMTHRSQIVGIEGSTTLRDAISYMLDANNSRFPVYEGNIDHIIGILHLKDACRLARTEGNAALPVKSVQGLLREAEFVAETRKINTIFREMQKRKIQMVVVIDEYGQTAGLVAMEDILEEIVGNIQDEYDEEQSHIEARGKDRFMIDGMSKLEDLEERFGIDFKEEEFETLNGFLISKMDRIPEEHDKFSIVIDGYCFQVIQVKHRRIEKVLVYKVPQTKAASEDETKKEKIKGE